ncbi:MAG: DUF3859 domain-containing protein [Burkholderiales bacterium]
MKIGTGMLLVSMCAAGGATAEALKGNVSEYGIYSAERKLLQRTQTVPNERGVKFGLCYEISGMEEDGSFMLVESLTHPPMQDARGVESTGYSVPRMYRFVDGTARGCLGYGFERDVPVAPGTWRFTISDGGVDVVAQEFVVR